MGHDERIKLRNENERMNEGNHQKRQDPSKILSVWLFQMATLLFPQQEIPWKSWKEIPMYFYMSEKFPILSGIVASQH